MEQNVTGIGGERKFEGGYYTVEGEATVEPTAIKITTNQKLTDQTLQYTAEVTAEDKADKVVTWSVADPTQVKQQIKQQSMKLPF